MLMPSGEGTAFFLTKRSTGAVAESVFMGITAVGRAAMGMPSGEGAALLLTKRSAGTVANTVFVCKSTVSHTAVGMPSGDVAAVFLTYAAGGGNSLSLPALIMMMPAVSGYRKGHDCG